MGFFHLTKWYLDCVTDQGNLLIGYAAMLRLGILRLPLVGSFSLIDGHIINSADMVVRWHKPVVADGQVNWDCPTMRVAGSWRTQAAPIRSVLFQQNDGQVTWECLQPRATASLRINGRPLEGHGYVECLDMDIPLWRLGLKRLVWGRYVSADDSLVWIEWQGAISLTRVWHGSDLVTQASIHSDRIDLLSKGCLTLQDTLTLREGSIETTVLKHMPVVRRVLPGWLRHIDEHKCLSRGLLTSGNQTSTGWVIHEAVTFGD